MGRTGLAVILAAAPLGLVACGEAERREDGPVRGAGITAVAWSAVVDRPSTFGFSVIYNVGNDEGVELERVELDQPDPGLRLVGSLVAGSDRKLNAVDTRRGFPPRGSGFGKPRPVAGATVPPERTAAGEPGLELLLGVQSSRLGSVGARGVIVYYRKGDKRWRARTLNAFTMCVRKRIEPGAGCKVRPPPEQGDVKLKEADS